MRAVSDLHTAVPSKNSAALLVQNERFTLFKKSESPSEVL